MIFQQPTRKNSRQDSEKKVRLPTWRSTTATNEQTKTPQTAPLPPDFSALSLPLFPPEAPASLPQPVQLRGGRLGATASLIRGAASLGLSGASSKIPFLSNIQRAFGRHDISQVQAHTDDAAAGAAKLMGAQAFATGNRIAFAGRPSVRTVAHEAAHIVQQRNGAQPDSGVGQVGDRWERQADAVAERVAGGQSAEALLDAMVPGQAAALGPASTLAPTSAPVQLLTLNGKEVKYKNFVRILAKKSEVRNYTKNDIDQLKIMLNNHKSNFETEEELIEFIDRSFPDSKPTRQKSRPPKPREKPAKDPVEYQENRVYWRNQFTDDKQKAPETFAPGDFLYHATSVNALEPISKSGLTTRTERGWAPDDASKDDFISAAKAASGAGTLTDAAAMLRFKPSKHNGVWKSYSATEVRTMTAVPADLLEIKTGPNSWVPLSSYVARQKTNKKKSISAMA